MSLIVHRSTFSAEAAQRGSARETLVRLPVEAQLERTCACSECVRVTGRRAAGDMEPAAIVSQPGTCLAEAAEDHQPVTRRNARPRAKAASEPLDECKHGRDIANILGRIHEGGNVIRFS